jgi:hypothetical protein
VLALILSAAILSGAATNNADSVVCGSDLTCWQRRVLILDQMLESERATNKLLIDQIKIADLQIALWRERAEYNLAGWQSTQRLLADATKAAEPKWHQAPALWYAIGASTTALLAVGLAAGLR